MSDRREWTHVRCTYRSEDIRKGLEARIADPLWMLARQWQFGEFEGDDAASLAHIQVEHTTLDVTTLQGAGGQRNMGPTDLIEPLVEAESMVSSPSVLRQSGEAGLQFLRRLPAKFQNAARKVLQDTFPLPATPAETTRGTRFLRALSSGSFDGAAFARQSKAKALGLARTVEIDENIWAEAWTGWKAYVADRFAAQTGTGYWNTQSLRHAVTVKAGSPTTTQATLRSDDHDGQHLDWHSFDLAEVQEKKAPPRKGRVKLLPTPVRYSGMPADRFWDFEQGDVYFGGLGLERTDLAQLVLTEFATVYSNDWFMAPVPVRTGTLSRVTQVQARDIFGNTHILRPSAAKDKAKRPWRFFEMTGDPAATQNKSPWLYIPRAVVGGETGRPVESVTLTRDEQANLAWGIETRVESRAGLPVDRAQEWQRLRDSVPAYLGDDTPAGEGEWVYRLLNSAPPHWVPFAPEIAKNRVTGRLRRSRMGEWDLLGELKDQLAGPKGKIMDPNAPMTVNEETLLRGGTIIERRYQTARAPDGRLLLWASRTARPASGDRSSGRTTDQIDIGPPPRPKPDKEGSS